MAEKLLTLSGGEILAMFGPEEWAEWLALRQAQGARLRQAQPPEPVVLPIPHLCQYGPGADARRNDCGAACVAMVARGLRQAQPPEESPTVDDVAVRFQSAPNKYMGFADLLRALRAYGLAAEYKRPLRAADIQAALRRGRAVIVLVKYPKLPRMASPFNGSHFLVVYGWNVGVFLYHDPLEASDEVLTIEAEALEGAMAGFENGENLPHQGIVVEG